MKKTKEYSFEIYLIILILLLILIFITSFKSGEKIYYLLNKNTNETPVITSDIAEWKFKVRIEY